MKSKVDHHKKSGNLIAAKNSQDDLEVLDHIQDRVLWLSTRMIDFANNDRPNLDGIKVGGHQASSASLDLLM